MQVPVKTWSICLIHKEFILPYRDSNYHEVKRRKYFIQMAPVKVAAVTILIAEKLKQFRREKGGPLTLIMGTHDHT